MDAGQSVEYVDADEFEALEALLHSAERRLGRAPQPAAASKQCAEHAVMVLRAPSGLTLPPCC